MRHLIVLGVLLFALPTHAVTIEWVTVGDPGNEADDIGYGSVAYTYRIGKYEVTNAQYAEFLNAVAATDTHELYAPAMGSVIYCYGGITRSGSPGSYTYSAIAGRENKPVNNVSFWDALRFANWLHNGQPTGAQGTGTIEDGAYTITAQGMDDNSITRNARAAIFLPSEDQWYKAAYYDAASSTYFDYPAGADAQTGCAVASGDTGNSANCLWAVGDLTDVGSYSLSESPFGAFDQGGNVWEWNETIIAGSGRGVRGGGFPGYLSYLAASARFDDDPSDQDNNIGFRVAMIPEPSTAFLLAAGLGGLAAARRRRL